MFKTLSRKLLSIAFAGLAALSLTAAVVAADKVRTDNVSDHNLAMKGYDAVAYFELGQPTTGKSRFTHTYKGIEYRFSTETNRDKFAQSPTKYAPQYGGFCAFGTSVGLKLEVDPEAFEIIDGKLYLNNSLDIHKMWLENPKGRIKAADSHWKRIRTVAAEELQPIGFDG